VVGQKVTFLKVSTYFKIHISTFDEVILKHFIMFIPADSLKNNDFKISKGIVPKNQKSPLKGISLFDPHLNNSFIPAFIDLLFVFAPRCAH